MLRVNSIKQRDETTRQNNVTLFDYFAFTSTQHKPQPRISHPYRCKITTESRKVLSLKIPQHYFFKAVDPISKQIQSFEQNQPNILNLPSPSCSDIAGWA